MQTHREIDAKSAAKLLGIGHRKLLTQCQYAGIFVRNQQGQIIARNDLCKQGYFVNRLKQCRIPAGQQYIAKWYEKPMITERGMTLIRDVLELKENDQ